MAIFDSVGNLVMKAILETKAETILPRNTDARGQKWPRNRVYPTSANSLFLAFFDPNEINRGKYDDQADSTSQALDWFKNNPAHRVYGLNEYWKREQERIKAV